MKRGNREQVHQAFLQSQVVVSVWNGPNLIGLGRAISDFKMYSSIFDVVVDPRHQKQGIGRLIMSSLIEQLKGTCIYLTSTFGNEEFYKKLGFRFHKSALALYPDKMQSTPYLFSNYQVDEALQSFNGVCFYLAKLIDSVGCYRLCSQLGYETDENSFTKRFLFLIAHPEHSVIVAKNKNGDVIAWMHMGLRFLLEDDHFAQIAAIVVHEDLRRLGLGSHLLKIAEDWARHHGMKEVCLTSSVLRENAHNFYLKNGYSNLKTSKLFAKGIL
jgi:GNAT superfamily N-acetyltransferase